MAVAAGFAPLNAWWAVPLGLAGFFATTAERPWGSAAVLGWIFGVAMFAPQWHFTAVSLGNPVGWIALTAVESCATLACALTWSLACRLRWLACDNTRGSVVRLATAALLWCGWEEIRCLWPWGGFPFGRVAYAMADAPLLPFAAYGGSVGVSFLVALSAACIAQSAQRCAQRRVLSSLAAVVVAVGLVLAPLALPVASAPEAGTVRVAAVQGNIASTPQASADAFARELEVTSNHARATEEMASQVGQGSLDVVIWPENAADRDPRTDPQAAALAEEAALSAGAPLLVGAVAYEGDVRYNDIVVWTPGQGPGEYYRKHRPVPFGEYVPMRSTMEKLSSQVQRIGTDMAPGAGPTTLTLMGAASQRPFTVAMGICFEVAYDDLLRDGVRDGGEFIVIPTNNASFGYSSQAAQQIAQGRVQAVIHGRSVVQVSTVGITAIVSPRGVVEQELPPFSSGALVADVPRRHSLTVADRLGAWPSSVVLVCTIGLALAGIVGGVHRTIAGLRRRHRRRRR